MLRQCNCNNNILCLSIVQMKGGKKKSLIHGHTHTHTLNASDSFLLHNLKYLSFSDAQKVRSFKMFQALVSSEIIERVRNDLI